MLIGALDAFRHNYALALISRVKERLNANWDDYAADSTVGRHVCIAPQPYCLIRIVPSGYYSAIHASRESLLIFAARMLLLQEEFT